MISAADRYAQEMLRRAQKREFYRRNFEAFAKDHIKIRGTEPGKIFSLDISARPAQRLLHDKCQKQLKEKGYIRGRGVKSRQQGWSTYSECRMLAGAVLQKNFNTLLVGNDKDTTETIFRIARFAYDSLTAPFKPMERYNSKSEMVFENPDTKTRTGNPGMNSRMTFVQAKELAGTGSTIQGLHTDETAKWPENACTMLENTLLPALHLVPGTIHLDTSTAFTRGDYFREKCDAARTGKTSYFFQFIPWWLDPTYSIPLQRRERFTPNAEERILIKLAARGQKKPDDVPPWEMTFEQLKWRRTIIADRTDGERLFAQEYPHTYEDAWVTTDVNVFPIDALQRQRANICMPSNFVTLKPSHINNYDVKTSVILRPPIDGSMGEDDNFCAIWRKPEPGHRYGMGVDVALGVAGGNWTVFEVFDQVTHEQVAEAHIHIDPDDAGWLAFTLGMYYNIAEINVELTGPGYNTDARLKKLSYPNLYIWKNRERYTPKNTSYTGWKTSPESKKFLIGMSRPMFSHDNVIIHSRLLLEELKHFVVIPGFIQDQYYAEIGDDDAVMAMMFALVVAFDNDYLDETLMPGGRQEISEEAKRALRYAAAAEGMPVGPWSVDNHDWSNREDSFDDVLKALKGWE